MEQSFYTKFSTGSEIKVKKELYYTLYYVISIEN